VIYSADEVGRYVALEDTSALVKSRTSDDQLLTTIHRLVNRVRPEGSPGMSASTLHRVLYEGERQWVKACHGPRLLEPTGVISLGAPVEQMGGSVGYESEPVRTVFRVNLPGAP